MAYVLSKKSLIPKQKRQLLDELVIHMDGVIDFERFKKIINTDTEWEYVKRKCNEHKARIRKLSEENKLLKECIKEIIKSNQ